MVPGEDCLIGRGSSEGVNPALPLERFNGWEFFTLFRNDF